MIACASACFRVVCLFKKASDGAVTVGAGCGSPAALLLGSGTGSSKRGEVVVLLPGLVSVARRFLSAAAAAAVESSLRMAAAAAAAGACWAGETPRDC